MGETTWFHAKDGMWVDISIYADRSEKVISAMVNNSTFKRLITSQSDPRIASDPRPTRLVVVGDATWNQAKDDIWCNVTSLTHLSEKSIWASVNNQNYKRITSQNDPRIVQVRPVPTIVTINSATVTMHYMKSKDATWYDVTEMFIHYSSGQYTKPVSQLIWTHLHNDISNGRIQALPSSPI